MAGSSIPHETTAPTHYCELVDVEGRLILLPAATVWAMRARGLSSITLTVSLDGAPPRPWLTVSEAARLHCDDVDGMTIPRAKVRISRACSRGEVVATGEGVARRIEPTSFDAWRLKEREKDLDRLG